MPKEILLDESKDPYRTVCLNSCGECKGYFYENNRKYIKCAERLLGAKIEP